MKYITGIFVSAFLFSSCATIFLPHRQAVKFTVSNEKSEVYLNKELISEGGTSFKNRVKRDGTAKQIVVKTPGYKDDHLVMVPTRMAVGYYFYQILNIPLVGYGIALDASNPKCQAYKRQFDIEVKNKLVNKTTNDKYVDISVIKLSIKDAKKDIKSFFIDQPSGGFVEKINEIEAERERTDAKLEAKLAKRKKKKGLDDFEEKGIKYDDTKFSSDMYNTLKTTGFVDTTNTFFTDYNNSLLLEGNITKINYYRISARRLAEYNKARVFLTWYVKNHYGEILDSVNTSEFSGDYVGDFTYFSNASTAERDQVKEKFFNSLNTMLADAINISYLNLHNNNAFAKHLKVGSNLAAQYENLKLATPKSNVTEKTEAGQATVIVKTADGHGSGFAISEDGYIITNYHVIAGRLEGKLNDVKVITSTGEELTSTVVRYNKLKDVALLKVNKKFDKVFKLPSAKSFTNFQDVFTIGAPKSVELGQSISTGVISNERKANGMDLIQLNMSVNRGNSGGPVFDSKGSLHGLIVSKVVGKNTEGICFAIPAYLVAQYLNIRFE